MGFSDMKKRSGDVSALSQKMEKMNDKKSYKDDRYWRPELDKSSNGYAVIRFLPAAGDEELPFARLYTHGFQGKGGWFIENCPTTLGKKCPVCEANSELWNSGLESDKDLARGRKRRLSYISNILVVSDPTNPQNEGKVFLYKYGKKIFDKIQESMKPEFEDESPVDPFDFWKGANFKLKVRKVAGYINYDKSEFEAPTALFDGDDSRLENLWKSEYSLQDIVAPTEFKSHEELKDKFDGVIGNDIRSTQDDSVTETAENIEPETTTVSTPAAETEEDALSFFNKLAADDE
jgi:hypothetical protein|tara:strand:+ start:39 stop:911 length:873 start_codon:yes stop_codon:yes gene_type:complete